jgi:diaminopimelate decarboxylase
MHVGSMLKDYEPFRLAYQRLADVVGLLRAQGLEVERLDLGGGVGIPYDGQTLAPFADYAAMVHEVLGSLGCALSFEPGRKLVGDAAVLVTRVVHVKETDNKTFIIVDAGMNDLVRPALYGARHEILSVRQNIIGLTAPVSVVGPVCETSDSFGDHFMLPDQLKAGDLLAIMQAGAYASAMASTYNGRPLIPEVLVSGARHAIIRRRIAVAEQMGWESIPDWMVIPRAA